MWALKVANWWELTNEKIQTGSKSATRKQQVKAESNRSELENSVLAWLNCGGDDSTKRSLLGHGRARAVFAVYRALSDRGRGCVDLALAERDQLRAFGSNLKTTNEN